MAKENFINYQNYRWLWVNVLFLLAMGTLYSLDQPLGGRGGDTAVGYFLGGVSTLGVLTLMWFGKRKRAYSSSRGTVMGWLAAHIWIGLALLILVPLHCGFQFGNNVHTLAYVLMVVTIVSGIWGALNYVQYPAQIMSNRGGNSSKKIFGNIIEINQEIGKLEQAKSDLLIKLLRRIDEPFVPRLQSILFARKTPDVSEDKDLRKLIMDLSGPERDDALNLVGLVREKKELIAELKQEISIDFYLKVWLFFHVPFSLALCVALAIHIFSVFYYW